MEQKAYVGLTGEEVSQRMAQGLSNKADLKAGRTEAQIVRSSTLWSRLCSTPWAN